MSKNSYSYSASVSVVLNAMPRYIRGRYNGTRLYLGYYNIRTTGLKQWDSSWSQASLSPNHWNALYRRRGSPVMSWIFIGAGQPLQHGEVRDSNLAWVGSVVLILVCHYRNVKSDDSFRISLICHLGYHCCPVDLLSELFRSTDDSNINFHCSVNIYTKSFSIEFSWLRRKSTWLIFIEIYGC